MILLLHGQIEIILILVVLCALATFAILITDYWFPYTPPNKKKDRRDGHR